MYTSLYIEGLIKFIFVNCRLNPFRFFLSNFISILKLLEKKYFSLVIDYLKESKDVS